MSLNMSFVGRTHYRTDQLTKISPTLSDEDQRGRGIALALLERTGIKPVAIADKMVINEHLSVLSHNDTFLVMVNKL